MSGTPHTVVWDDADTDADTIDVAEMMRRAARVLDAELRERQFRGEPRFELRRHYTGGLELSIVAGHINDDREALSLAIELRAAGVARPLTSVHLSSGIERVKASRAALWLRARGGAAVLIGENLGGIVEVQF